MVLPNPKSSITQVPQSAITRKTTRVSSLVQALRVHQWIKNILVFVPVLMAHRILDVREILLAGYAFIAWCFCASAVYLLNDLLDLDTDRNHPRKKHRPLAARAMGTKTAWALIPLLLGSGLVIAIVLLPPSFLVALILYIALTTAYSFGLKQLLIVDVLMLASLYALRVLSGGYATGIVVSPWLLGFSMFLFLSLAFVKRYTELSGSDGENRIGPTRRGYTTQDMELLKVVGPASGYLAVLVMALYINSKEVSALYRKPTILWLIGPLLLYWITRVWLLAHRGQMDDDPIVFTVKDPTSYVVGALIAAVIIAATLWK